MGRQAAVVLCVLASVVVVAGVDVGGTSEAPVSATAAMRLPQFHGAPR